MQKILVLLLVALYGVFCDTARACDMNEIDVFGDDTNCQTAKFTITTTNLSANTEFKFSMSAMGTFYVDWGDGTIDTIIRDNTTPTLYNHKYTAAGVKTIRFGGLATAYSTEQKIGVISFGYYYYDNVGMSGATTTLVRSISGSLGAIFPTLAQSNTGTSRFPKFISVFYLSKINSIPENLFSGVSGGIYKMFDSSFANTNITSIPENLFAGITGGGQGDVFFQTFMGCSKLTFIPSGLFKNTTSIAGYSFYATFKNCTSLTSIPENLFSKVRFARSNLFTSTFYGCTGLTGYIPPALFSGLIANGSTTLNDMWTSTFSGTNLATTCPAGTVQFITGYEDYWDGHVSCVDENLVCGSGEYLPQHWYQCEKCPNNNYCSGGTYTYNGNSQGATACPSGLYSSVGMWESAQCGRILHIGDEVVYLRQTKKTTPALHIDIDNDGIADFFGNVTTADVPMHAGSERKLKLQHNGITYSVYDDTVDVGE